MTSIKDLTIKQLKAELEGELGAIKSVGDLAALKKERLERLLKRESTFPVASTLRSENQKKVLETMSLEHLKQRAVEEGITSVPAAKPAIIELLLEKLANRR